MDLITLYTWLLCNELLLWHLQHCRCTHRDNSDVSTFLFLQCIFRFWTFFVGVWTSSGFLYYEYTEIFVCLQCDCFIFIGWLLVVVFLSLFITRGQLFSVKTHNCITSSSYSISYKRKSTISCTSSFLVHSVAGVILPKINVIKLYLNVKLDKKQ